MISSVTSWTTAAWSKAWDTAKRLAIAFVTATVAYLQRIRATVQAVASFIGDGFSRAWSAAQNGVAAFRRVVEDAMSAVRRVIESVQRAAARVLDTARNAASSLNPFSWFGEIGPRLGVTYEALPEIGRPFYMTAAIGEAPSLGYAPASDRGNMQVVNITVEGAIDPSGVARQIKAILSKDAIRDGRALVGGEYL